MAKLNVFIREKITDLNTPDHIVETEYEKTIYDYDKRILFTTASRETTIFEVGSDVAAGTFDGDGIVYGRITNNSTLYPLNLRIINSSNDSANFSIPATGTFFLNDEKFTPTSGSWLDIDRVLVQPSGSRSSKVKIEYFLAAGSITT